jgi:hypothetical protein
MLQFRLQKGGDGTKYYQKIKRMQRAYLSSIEKKCDTTRRRDGVDQRRGSTEERKERR